MNWNALESIPPEHHDTVRSALIAEFGARPVTALQPVLGGTSALAYRMEIAGNTYLLRLDIARDTLRDPARGYACMRLAAEAGVAPPLHYADPNTGIAIMDFVRQRPLSEYPGGPECLLRELGGLIARLQMTPVFPIFSDYLVILERMLGFVAGSRLFAPGLLNPHLEGFARIRDAYRWNAVELVSSHNDPNPRNVLFDGERLWLIDWETSFRNDPLADLAILANNLAATAELEAVLLRAWLGRTPGRLLRARVALMRQLTRLYYAGIILVASARAAQGAAPDPSLAAPTQAEFAIAMREGRLTATRDVLYTIAKMCLAGFLAGVSTPEFEEALVISRQG
jgi:aminoglycoside phosphotransferase (APT) family kinase protein